MKLLPEAYQVDAYQKPIFMYLGCCHKFLQEISWDVFLQEHILNNTKNMNTISSLNKIEEPPVAPHLAFAQIYQIKGYGQYGMHGSIVNVPTNLDLIQIILLHLPHDSSIVAVHLKRKLEYKSIYMSDLILL
jgi:hypothetical protein